MYSAAKLLTLDFQATIREAEKANWKDLYIVSKRKVIRPCLLSLFLGAKVHLVTKGLVLE
jgi:hypothetical protein